MSEGMGMLRDPASMDLDELKIRSDELRRVLNAVELRLEFLDHYPSVKKIYAEATHAASSRLKLYERLINEREGDGDGTGQRAA